MASLVRRLLDRAARPRVPYVPPHFPERGDAIEAWLKEWRDRYDPEVHVQWHSLNQMLDEYRLHADTGTPLDEHVCEGGNVDDCAGCYDAARAADNLSRTLAAAQRRAEKAEAERDGAYRERAQLVALLAALYPATLAYNDPTAPEWAVVYVDLPTGQASWHVAPADVELFAHVHRDDSHEWDGHTTEEKYQRIAELADEQAGADRYAAMVNAPLRPETIAAINERLKAGDVPVRKVKARGADAES